MRFDLATEVGVDQAAPARNPGGSKPCWHRLFANEQLDSPLFWATHYYLLCNDEGHDETELCEELFGVTAQAVNDFFCKITTWKGKVKPWPYFQLPLTNSTFVEVQYADHPAEYRTQYKIGDAAGAIVLGYHSGHFSLPALRWSEVKQIASAIADGCKQAQCVLLLLPGVYINEGRYSQRNPCSANYLRAILSGLKLSLPCLSRPREIPDQETSCLFFRNSETSILIPISTPAQPGFPPSAPGRRNRRSFRRPLSSSRRRAAACR